MKTPIAGLHHVTAIASDPQRNLDFYTLTLGLRFVKRTVNFDDPGTYHFYFGDDAGTPGTILTFFPWPHAKRGVPGVGETVATAFSIPAGSSAYWRSRLADHGTQVVEQQFFGKTHLRLEDPDGMVLELVEHAEIVPLHTPRYSDVAAESAIQGFFGVTLLEAELERTERFLGQMGYRKVEEEGNRVRFTVESEERGRVLDIVINPTAHPGRMGAGTVHHIAFRAADDAAQEAWQQELGPIVGVTPVQDRTYFHSIYFREPGGVLFEIATDNPGFAIDEPVEALGEKLCIPPWFEHHRKEIEARVRPITLHKAKIAVTEKAGV